MLRCLIILCLFACPLTAAEERPMITHAVLVHGIWESGKHTFPKLRERLEASGVEVLVPRLRPATAHHGLMPLAKQLKFEIEEAFGSEQEFLLVGFSMGGIVGRAYLQELGGHKRCQTFVTISSPHQGTKTAVLHPGQGTEDMQPGSKLLSHLADTENVLGDLPSVAYWTKMDFVIQPPRNAIWERAENVLIKCPLHAMMSDSEDVRADLLARFRFPQVAPEIRKSMIKGPPHRR